MRVTSALRQQIWTQTESAVMSDVNQDHPEVVGPAPITYRLWHWPPLPEADGRAFRRLNVRLSLIHI
eukprot:13102574-Alexandrium_andersonii.AAC.1